MSRRILLHEVSKCVFVEVMLPFGLNRRQDENKFVAAVCVCARAWKTAQPIFKI
jgi:hypothetical protein